MSRLRHYFNQRKAIRRTALLIAVVLCFLVISISFSSSHPTMPELSFVAHAGGESNGQDYLNSIDALDLNYARGYRYFELDFSWTSDGALVGIHDWERVYQRYFEQNSTVPDLAGFSQQVMKNGSLPVTMARLQDWLAQHDDARVITDIKDRNVAGLSWIRNNFPHVAQKIIPQIYSTQEYEDVRREGYADIIVTVYRLPGTARKAVLELAKNEKLFAVTMPEAWFYQYKLFDNLMELGVPVCIHTINQHEQLEILQSKGVSCVYTDSLISEKASSG